MMAEITTALASVKTTVDIAKGMAALNTDVAVKTKASELLSSVIEVQGAVLSLQETVNQLQTDNAGLKAELTKVRASAAEADTMHFRDGVYWKDGNEVPFCRQCWEDQRKAIHLSGPHRGEDIRTHYECDKCGWTKFLD